MLGEADYHNDEERAVLDQTGGDETDMGNPEESKEVQLAKAILDATKSQNYEQVMALANQLIDMHRQQSPTGGTYGKKMVLSMMTGVPSQSFPSSP